MRCSRFAFWFGLGVSLMPCLLVVHFWAKSDVPGWGHVGSRKIELHWRRCPGEASAFWCLSDRERYLLQQQVTGANAVYEASFNRKRRYPVPLNGKCLKWVRPGERKGDVK